MSRYPSLLELATQQLHPLDGCDSFLVGRNETANLCVADPTCSRQHFRLIRREGHYHVEPLNALNPTYHNGRVVSKSEPLEHGAFLQAGQTRFQFLLRGADEANASRAAAAPEQFTVMATSATASEAILDRDIIPLAGEMLIGRDKGLVQVYLPHPQVSRCHASIALQGTTALLTDLSSANGTFVNGMRLSGKCILQPGDQVDIGPYALRFTGSALLTRPRSDNVQLVARDVRRVVRNRETSAPLTLLDDVTLVIQPREFVCLLGPSGSGKSTLLSILSGRSAPDAGAVLLNGTNLHDHFEALKQDIAVVPQKDVLHESLAVGQALWYTAKLRLPPDTNAQEIESSLTEMLDTVGLSARRATTIRHLSGGQIKRASLANEILCKPSLLFLDEVTSGLDEQTDREVMNLFRGLADAGKTVVCITHSLANVERTCHLVVILTPGGKLAFIGKPAEALTYFDIDRLGDVYDRLAEQPAEHWQQKYRQSPFWKRYVADRLPPPVESNPLVEPARSRTAKAGASLFWRQTVLVSRRYAAIWRGDYPSLLAMAGQTLLVAVLLGLLFGDLSAVEEPYEHARSSVNLLFLLAVSSFWFGCNSAAKEIVKERVIYTRERDFNLLAGSYYASKLLLLTLMSCLQAVLLLVVVRAWCSPPGPWGVQLLVLMALALAGVTLGLAISVFATTEEMAITLIPMAVIPQIILSGAISPLKGISKFLARVGISTYWGKRGLDASLPSDVTEYLPGLERPSVSLPVLILLIHAALCIFAALGALLWQNYRRRGLAALLRRVPR